jgi:hypothetical protein
LDHAEISQHPRIERISNEMPQMRQRNALGGQEFNVGKRYAVLPLR